MSDTTVNTSGGIGFTGLLTIAFVVLKLTHFIDWSWWWVLSPVWIGAAILVAMLVVAAAIRARSGKTAPPLERFPRELWPDGPGGGPYSDRERKLQAEHRAKWREQEKECTCHWRDGDWLVSRHTASCVRVRGGK